MLVKHSVTVGPRIIEDQRRGCDDVTMESFVRRGMLLFGLLAAVAVGLAACGPEKQAAAPEPRPVRTVTARPRRAQKRPAR